MSTASLLKSFILSLSTEFEILTTFFVIPNSSLRVSFVTLEITTISSNALLAFHIPALPVYILLYFYQVQYNQVQPYLL